MGRLLREIGVETPELIHDFLDFVADIAANDNAETKRNKIVNAINDRTALTAISATAVGTDQLTIEKSESDVIIIKGINSAQLVQDSTGEFDSIESPPAPGFLNSVNRAEVTFGDVLSALDASGQPSCYEAGIQTLIDPVTGLEALLDAFACSDEIIASEGDLTGFSVASYLFEDLEFQKRSLEEDLGVTFPYSAVLSEGSGIITFNFTEPRPAKVFFGTSSPTGTVSGSLSLVPEPSSIVLLLVGLVCIVRRRL